VATTADLFENLSGDAWRVSHSFSDDLLQANAVLHNRAATEAEMAECAMLWCLRRQPCQFGRVAASQGRIHFCFLSEQAVSQWSDEEIAEKVAEERRLWKQRAAFEPLRGAHSFVLVVASPRVAFAAPDAHLRKFSDRILELAGWEPDRRGARRANAVSSDFLYLKHPNEDGFYGYQYNVDFFACAGDGRWWRDHRFPGGIAFTANSTGHMIATGRLYEGLDDGREWALKQAMLTIKNSAKTRETESEDPLDQGKVTWLRPLGDDGKPLVAELRCPISKVPRTLVGKDWTRYEGVLHTDHAVREEFFMDRDVAPTAPKPYLMDFTYLYDERQEDFVDFTGGKPFSPEEIFAEIGRPEEWTHRGAESRAECPRSELELLTEQLEVCRQWTNAYAGLTEQ
jgi:hypothetical protein